MIVARLALPLLSSRVAPWASSTSSRESNTLAQHYTQRPCVLLCLHQPQTFALAQPPRPWSLQRNLLPSTTPTFLLGVMPLYGQVLWAGV